MVDHPLKWVHIYQGKVDSSIMAYCIFCGCVRIVLHGLQIIFRLHFSILKGQTLHWLMK